MKKALPVIMGLLERETRGWFLHFREKLIYELKTQKLSDEEIEKVKFLLYNPIYTLLLYLIHFFSLLMKL